jgi:hypothetical protein
MIDIADLKKMAEERPDTFDLKASGILKLIAEIERLRSIAIESRACCTSLEGVNDRLCERLVMALEYMPTDKRPEFEDKWQSFMADATATSAPNETQPK